MNWESLGVDDGHERWMDNIEEMVCVEDCHDLARRMCAVIEEAVAEGRLSPSEGLIRKMYIWGVARGRYMTMREVRRRLRTLDL